MELFCVVQRVHIGRIIVHGSSLGMNVHLEEACTSRLHPAYCYISAEESVDTVVCRAVPTASKRVAVLIRFMHRDEAGTLRMLQFSLGWRCRVQWHQNSCSKRCRQDLVRV
jgi:hypothetical protein